jgi:hypothetical protein
MSFKTFDLAHDVASLVSPINEVVSISSATFTTGSDTNIKFFTNIATGTLTTSLGGYWQTIYDASPTSSQSTPLFDMTFGYSSSSAYYGNVSSPSASVNEKSKVYREMASSLLGNPDSEFTIASFPARDCFFIMIKRGLMKDELKKGSVGIQFTGSRDWITGSDTSAAQSFKQTVGGDYAPLFSGSTEVGQVWYNAGVIVVPASSSAQGWVNTESNWSGSTSLPVLIASSTIDDLVDGLRAHTKVVAFHNQTNLYSTIYFCRATNTEFNYSSNPTYVDENKRIRVTSGSNVLQSRTYITTIGLYDANDNLLAVGKLNKAITKTPDTEAIFRIRLDY